jgi:hypothetical protein
MHPRCGDRVEGSNGGAWLNVGLEDQASRASAGAGRGGPGLGLATGTIVDCAERVREPDVPIGVISVATFQEHGSRTVGQPPPGVEMTEPAGDRLASRT